MSTVDMQIITDTFNLLEDLAKVGVIRVTINQPPPEYGSYTLPGVYALVPAKPKGFQSDALWRTMDHHGGHSCGNGLGLTKDKTMYWVQSQSNRPFFTGHYEWVGQATNEYRKWYAPEIEQLILQ